MKKNHKTFNRSSDILVLIDQYYKWEKVKNTGFAVCV